MKPEKIESFKIDHNKLLPGIYVSRKDGDIVTYDLRTRKPNCGSYMDNITMHSVEHMIATYIRSSAIAKDIIYFGPMGCQTGFYLLMRGEEHQETLFLIKETLEKITDYTGEMPGNSEIECGNYRNLSIALAKGEAMRYYDKIKNLTVEDMRYAE